MVTVWGTYTWKVETLKVATPVFEDMLTVAGTEIAVEVDADTVTTSPDAPGATESGYCKRSRQQPAC